MLPRAQRAGVRILVGDDYSGVFRTLLADDPLDHQVGNYGREFAFYAAIAGLSPGRGAHVGHEQRRPAPGRPAGKVGVVEAGALADLIVVDGDPLADLSLLARPEEALKAVIRDGSFVIDRLPPRPASAAA